MTDVSKDTKDPQWWPFLVVASLALVAWAAYLFIAPKFFPDWTSRGQFGDMFGALNALFSAIAFAALVYTMILQKAELRLQRKELEETRGEIKGQKEQLEIQTKTFVIQNFESTFFNILTLHHKIVDGTDIRVSSSTTKDGRDCYIWLANYLDRKCYQALDAQKGAPNPAPQSGSTYSLETLFFITQKSYQQIVPPLWEQLYREHRSDLGHYFRNLYHVAKFVDSNAALCDREKRQYMGILRAQLSYGELSLLFHNGLSARAAKFKPLIEKYALLKNMESDQFMHANHRDEYARSAFGS
jgi:hypothetical protein